MSCAQVMYQPYATQPPPSHTSQGGGGEGAQSLLHAPQPLHPTTSITPPHHLQHHHQHHQHHHQHSPQHSDSGGDSGGSNSSSSQPPLQQQLPRPHYRGSPHTEPDNPPPEKKLCRETEVTLSVAPSTSSTPQQQQQPSTSTAPPPPAPPPPPHSRHHHHHHHHLHSESPEATEQQANGVKYVSANCMVVTHCSGDAADLVDQHFSRALSTHAFVMTQQQQPEKATSPMTSRNFPPSFWNSHYQPPPPPPSSSSSTSSSSSRPPSLAPHHLAPSPGDLYDPHHYPHHHHHHHYTPGHHTDPWAAYSLSSQAYGARGVGHDVYPSLSSPSPRTYPQYPALSLQPHHLPCLAPVTHQVGVSKSEAAAAAWGGRYSDHFTTATDLSHHTLDPTSYPASHYHTVPGLESGVPVAQEGAKDLYWF